MWRPIDQRVPASQQLTSSQNVRGNGDLSFIAPSYSQSNTHPQYRNFNTPTTTTAERRPRIVNTQNSDTASMSHYHGGRNGTLQAQAMSNLRPSGTNNREFSLFGNSSSGNNSQSGSSQSNRNSNSSQGNRRSNGMQEGFGPVQIPEGNTMRVEGVNPEDDNEEPSVEIKQTIRTEYKIRKNGIVYIGAINETNIWGSHQHPEC